MLKQFLEEIIPSCENYSSNKKLKEKAAALETLDDLQKEFCAFGSAEIKDAIKVDALKTLQEKELERKRTFEDKAKTNVVGVTIAVTLIMGAYGLCNNIYAKYQYAGLHWFVFVLFVIAALYMIGAGIISIGTITNLNIVFILENEGFDLSEEEQCNKLNICIGKNRIWNIIRNNNVFTAYECIRNSLVCLFVVLVVSIAPFTQKNSISQIASSREFFYSTVVAEYIAQDDLQDEVVSDVDKFLKTTVVSSNKAGNLYGFVNNDKTLYIKIRVESDAVYILTVEPITSP